ncbi:MAG: DUF2130 domain-containing protein [Terracidiphilus sp.]
MRSGLQAQEAHVDTLEPKLFREVEAMPQDLEIKCPGCGTVIRLDETLAGPAISRIKAEASEAIRKATEDANAKVAKAMNLEATLAAKERGLAEREASVQTLVNQAIAVERQRITAAERESILKELSPELEAERAKAKDLQEKLTNAQSAELQLRQEKAAIDQRARDLELEVARKVDEQRKAIQEQASQEAKQIAEQKIEEKDKSISELQAEITAKATRTATLESSLAAKDRELAEKEASVQTQVNLALAVERQKIAESERENILKELSPELEAERAKAKDLQGKLAIAQSAELQLRQEKGAIDQRAKDLELEVARKVDEQRKAIQEQASKDIAEANRLKLAEKDKTISEMQQKLEEAQRKATQGSQQTQGEVLEADLENTLRKMFPQDTIEPVKTGIRGGDILQRVLGEMGQPVGTIFWETKRAQDWGRDWIAKAKQDAAEGKAEIAAIVSEVLPKGLNAFGLRDGVWCVHPTHAVALAVAIRQGIMATAEARKGALGRETKKERLYDYMIGPEFRAIVEGIALPFRELSEELMAEKRATIARWKRQEKRIERVLTSVASMQGDLQGIAGSEMPKLAGFELEAGVHEIAASSDA